MRVRFPSPAPSPAPTQNPSSSWVSKMHCAGIKKPSRSWWRAGGSARHVCSSRAGSGSGRPGASDREVPDATPEIQRPKNQEQGCPSVGAVREEQDAAEGQDAATGKTRGPRRAEVAVLPWIDPASRAGSRRRCPPPAQAFRSDVAIGSVHRNVSCDMRCPATQAIYQSDIILIDGCQGRSSQGADRAGTAVPDRLVNQEHSSSLTGPTPKQ